MNETTMESIEGALPLDPNIPLCVVDVIFRSGGKAYFFDPDELEIPVGTHVITDTARGVEFGTCTAGRHTVLASEVVMPLRRIVRIATADDERMAAEYRAKEKDAFQICLQKIEEHGLDMQLVSAEYAFDGSKLLFFFTADGRVDFRELVKSLAAVFRTRIELRQIGVRDKAKMVGGLGVCGRPFCCSEFLDDFQPVSIKMAKVQNLSLNPTKISGTCGRLMCCLKYEEDAYEDLLRQSPREESFVDTPDGRGTVMEVNLLCQSVKVRMEEHPEEINCYQNCDICVLRNGKAHKNDAPIPKEVAPISGNQERKPKLRSTPRSDFLAETENRTPEAPEKPHRKPKIAKETAVTFTEQAEKPADVPQHHRKKGSKTNALRPEAQQPRQEAGQPHREASKPQAEGKLPQKPPRPHNKYKGHPSAQPNGSQRNAPKQPKTERNVP